MPSDIESVGQDPANPRFRCTICQTRGMANYEHHVRSTTHQNKVKSHLSRLAAKQQCLVGLEAEGASETNTTDPIWMEQGNFETDPISTDPPLNPPSPLSTLRHLEPFELLGPASLKFPTDMDDPDGHVRFDILRQALENLENLDLEDEEDDLPEEEESQDPDLVRAREQEAKEWHPFKNKEVSDIIRGF